nr:MAG TPA: hypothetical protein [Caudoviricetes sp.]
MCVWAGYAKWRDGACAFQMMSTWNGNLDFPI